MDTTGARVDAVELLSMQHRDVDQLWTQLEAARAAGGDAHLAQDLANRIITMLSKHDAIETMLLYPALREAPTGGDAMADHALEEHQRIRELLKEADRKDIRDEGAFRSLTEAIGMVKNHVHEEESRMFPALRELGEERVMSLGEQMQTAWAAAPTHPHPSTPNSGLGATVVGAVAGVVDRVRDALGGKERR